MQSNHLVIWFRDMTRCSGNPDASAGFPEALFDSLCAGRVLEKRYIEEGILWGAEVTFESKRAGSDFASKLHDARNSTGTEPWVRGAEALACWRTGKGLFEGEMPAAFVRQFFLEDALAQ